MSGTGRSNLEADFANLRLVTLKVWSRATVAEFIPSSGLTAK